MHLTRQQLKYQKRVNCT